jgi:hypothetical protein
VIAAQAAAPPETSDQVNDPNWTGEDTSVVLFLPSCPLLLNPQDQSVQLVLIAKQNELPTDIFDQSVNNPT